MPGFPPFVLSCALALGQGAADAARVVERALEPGARLERQLPSGETHAYSITLQAGEFLPLAVDQDGVDVVLTVTGPDTQAVEIDVPDDLYGREPASLLATTSGAYRVGIRERNAIRGGRARYVLEAEAVRQATETDRQRFAAERSLAQATALVRTGKPEALKEGLGKLDAALESWRALGDGYWEAETLLQRARANVARRALPKVIEDATAALPLWRRLGDRRGEALALYLAGRAHAGLFDFDRAVQSFQDALVAQRTLDDPQQEADILTRLGRAHSGRGDNGKYVETARELVALWRARGDRASQATALVELGSAHANASDLQGTLEHLRAAQAIRRTLGDRGAEALILQNLGAVYETLGDSRSALAAFDQALPVLLEVGNLQAAGSAYHNMGSSYSSLGEPKKALAFFEKAVALRLQTNDRRGEAHALVRIGNELNTLREYEKAVGYLDTALKIGREINDPWVDAGVQLALGQARAETGRFTEARDHLQRAVEQTRALTDHVREARALYLLARLANGAGDLADAKAKTETALDVLEAMRRRITSPRLRSTFVASVRESYELYVDVLMGLHRRQPDAGLNAAALEASELARARGLLDVLAQGGLEIREGSEPQLLTRERALQDRLAAALDRQLRASKESQAAEAQQAAARQVQLLTAEWDELKAALRAKAPRFAALREPVRPNTAAIQKDVLDADTVLLEYALGEKRSYLWVVSVAELTSYELPPRAAIEAAAREAYAELAELSGGGGATPRTSTERAAGGAVGRLSQMVLGPAAEVLLAQRLLVVADGALHYVPFAALPDPRGSGQPLVVRHEIVSAPSVSVLPLLRRDADQRRAPSRTLAVMADPVFDRRDARLGKRLAAAAPRGAGDQVGQALRDSGLEGGLPRLPFTRREADAILSLVAARDRKAALDFDASRATVTEPSLADYRFLHFATHGFLNSAHPELSGIVLSLLDRQGRDAPGFLTTSDIFNLRLNADLVVLSGCRTALGRDLRGEGLVGLSRGFMYAGAPRVMASLWKVDDAATAELMRRLYDGILKRGLTPAAALRAAQLDLMRKARFRHPFYWAAFQLQGEWR